MGVWIEMFFCATYNFSTFVTPFVGVWIEILLIRVFRQMHLVTPFVGVWIEILYADRKAAEEESHSLRGSVD